MRKGAIEAKKDRLAVYLTSAEGSADDSQNLSPRKGAAVSDSGGREPRNPLSSKISHISRQKEL